MNGQDMQFRDTDERNSANSNVQMEQQPRDFYSGGGGGGKAYVAFGGSSSSTSVVCRTDPQNPNQQICKHITKRTVRDPQTGQTRTETSEREEIRPQRNSGFFHTNYGSPNNGGQNANYEVRESFIDRLRNRWQTLKRNMTPVESSLAEQPYQNPAQTRVDQSQTAPNWPYQQRSANGNYGYPQQPYPRDDYMDPLEVFFNNATPFIMNPLDLFHSFMDFDQEHHSPFWNEGDEADIFDPFFKTVFDGTSRPDNFGNGFGGMFGPPSRFSRRNEGSDGGYPSGWNNSFNQSSFQRNYTNRNMGDFSNSYPREQWSQPQTNQPQSHFGDTLNEGKIGPKSPSSSQIYDV